MLYGRYCSRCTDHICDAARMIFDVLRTLLLTLYGSYLWHCTDLNLTLYGLYFAYYGRYCLHCTDHICDAERMILDVVRTLLFTLYGSYLWRCTDDIRYFTDVMVYSVRIIFETLYGLKSIFVRIIFFFIRTLLYTLYGSYLWLCTDDIRYTKVEILRCSSRKLILSN